MNILVTAGNTLSPIDRVRCITNIFTGRTGTRIAIEAQRRGHSVTLLTSHPEVVIQLDLKVGLAENWTVVTYRTFNDLERRMSELILSGQFDVLVHAAAVSDYESAGLYASRGKEKTLLDTEGKVKSSHSELWLHLKPTPKLVDQVRSPWGFRGTLVKFKLEVGTGDEELRRIAAKSREQSDADLIVANTLEGKEAAAFIGDRAGAWERVERADLARRLLERVEEVPPRRA